MVRRRRGYLSASKEWASSLQGDAEKWRSFTNGELNLIILSARITLFFTPLSASDVAGLRWFGSAHDVPANEFPTFEEKFSTSRTGRSGCLTIYLVTARSITLFVVNQYAGDQRYRFSGVNFTAAIMNSGHYGNLAHQMLTFTFKTTLNQYLNQVN
jgi:hypothetical protein